MEKFRSAGLRGHQIFMDRIGNLNPRMQQVYEEFVISKPIELYFDSWPIVGIKPRLIPAHIALTHLDDPYDKSIPVFDLNLL